MAQRKETIAFEDPADLRLCCWSSRRQAMRKARTPDIGLDAAVDDADEIPVAG